jgi:hypothetical protein
MWFQMFARGLTNRRAAGGAQISLAVGGTYQYEPEFMHSWQRISSVVHWWPRIQLTWFTINEVADLCEKISSQLDAKRIYEICGGQPYITHSMCNDSSFLHACEAWLKQPSEANARTVRATQPFVRHARALRRSMFSLSSVQTPLLREVLSTLTLPDRRNSALANVSAEILGFLRKAQFIDSANGATPELYRLFAEELLGTDQV